VVIQAQLTLLRSMSAITLNVRAPGAAPQAVTVCPLDAVQTLVDRLPPGGRRYVVCSGSILMPSFSFKFHGVKDGDDVYLVEVKWTNPTPSQPQIDRSSHHRLFTREVRSGDRQHSHGSLFGKLARICDRSGQGAFADRQTGAGGEERGPMPWTDLAADRRKAVGPSTDALPTWW